MRLIRITFATKQSRRTDDSCLSEVCNHCEHGGGMGGAAAEVPGRADGAGAPRAVFITAYLIKKKKKIDTMCGSVHTPQAPRFFIRVPRLRSLAEIQSVSQVLVCDGRWSVGWGWGEAGIRELDLLVTITIELLYKAPVDNIGGITERERQSSFIKKKKREKKTAWLVLKGDKGYLRAGRVTSVSSLCRVWGGGGVLSVSPAASLGFINLWIYFVHVYCADTSNAPTHESFMNMHAC